MKERGSLLVINTLPTSLIVCIYLSRIRKEREKHVITSSGSEAISEPDEIGGLLLSTLY